MENNNLTKDEVINLVASGKIRLKPLWGSVITTVNTIDKDEDGLLLDAVSFDEDQIIVAVGRTAPEVLKVGMKVKVDLNALTSRVMVGNDANDTETKILLDPVMIDGVMYNQVESRHIKSYFLD